MDHIWENWSDSEEELLVERRQYKMFQRIDMSNWDDEDFIYRFRLSKQSVSQVLQMIRSPLENSQERSRYIKPMTKLLIALRFFASGSFQVSIADFSGVSIASVCRIIKQVSFAIAQKHPLFIRMPITENEMAEAGTAFYQFSRFPRTIGAIDCTHVKIQSPGGQHAENYRNRKGWFSYNVQAVCSAKMKFVNIISRWPGGSHDQTIFNNSFLKMKFEQGRYGRNILVGDSGYRNTFYMATPFLNCQNEAQQLYNESQIRTRNVIERTFGIWKRRFPILSMGMRVSLPTVRLIIVACAVLHNIAIDSNDVLPPVNIDGFEEAMASANIQHTQSHETGGANNIREQFLLPYFQSLIENS